ncbi:MAG TPA: hypothetical protein VMS65_02030, partial [Polyangiaceae bacterium]|nr:hypothetical protein [Polyangiaceae bacterium]
RHLFREMSEEAPDVCKRFASKDGDPRLAAELVTRLVSHPFRMNVRELRSLLWSSLHESEGEWLEWPRTVAGHAAAATDDDDDDANAAALRASEVERVLAENGGSIEKSWRALGLSSRFALMRLLKKHGISVKKDVKRG